MDLDKRDWSMSIWEDRGSFRHLFADLHSLDNCDSWTLRSWNIVFDYFTAA